MIDLERNSQQKCIFCASRAVVFQLKSVNLYDRPDVSLEEAENYYSKTLSVIPANQVALKMYLHALFIA